MSKYYCLIAGLPTVSLYDAKAVWTVADFKAELRDYLTDSDRRLLNWFFLKYDNANLLAYLRRTAGYRFDTRAALSEDDIKEICTLLHDEDRTPENIEVPAYLARFVREYYARFDDEENDENQLLEDRLSALYYNEATHCGNAFMSAWFELNLNVGNIFAAINCRKYGLDKSRFIIGDSETAAYLRQSSSRDFSGLIVTAGADRTQGASGFSNPLAEAPDVLAQIIQIAEEQDVIERERSLDAMRWEWLERNTFFKAFDIESVAAYIMRLEIIERWISLDRTRGETQFRSLVGDMKRESSIILDEFKENHK